MLHETAVWPSPFSPLQPGSNSHSLLMMVCVCICDILRPGFSMISFGTIAKHDCSMRLSALVRTSNTQKQKQRACDMIHTYIDIDLGGPVVADLPRKNAGDLLCWSLLKMFMSLGWAFGPRYVRFPGRKCPPSAPLQRKNWSTHVARWRNLQIFSRVWQHFPFFPTVTVWFLTVCTVPACGSWICQGAYQAVPVGMAGAEVWEVSKFFLLYDCMMWMASGIQHCSKMQDSTAWWSHSKFKPCVVSCNKAHQSPVRWCEGGWRAYLGVS